MRWQVTLAHALLLFFMLNAAVQAMGRAVKPQDSLLSSTSLYLAALY